MRAHLLSSVVPALALLAVGCGPADEADTAQPETAQPEAAEAEAAEVTETEVVEAEVVDAPAEPEPEPVETAAAEPEPAVDDEAMEAALEAVELRQAPMKLMAWNMGPLFPMMRGDAAFDAEVVETNTGRVATIAPMIPGVFSEDVGDFDLETRALSRVWDTKDEFDGRAAALADAASSAAAAAASGDEAATMEAVQAIGQACGDCHDDFRAE